MAPTPFAGQLRAALGHRPTQAEISDRAHRNTLYLAIKHAQGITLGQLTYTRLGFHLAESNDPADRRIARSEARAIRDAVLALLLAGDIVAEPDRNSEPNDAELYTTTPPGVEDELDRCRATLARS